MSNSFILLYIYLLFISMVNCNDYDKIQNISCVLSKNISDVIAYISVGKIMTKNEDSNRQMLKCPIIDMFTIDHLHAQMLVQNLNTIKNSIK